jgi:hypothetical protein
MMARIKTTPYYEEFLRYYSLARQQQEKSNLGMTPHAESGVNDDLMEQIELYDVVERKYAGFSQITHDVFYGWTENHPYWDHMKVGHVTDQRKQVAKNWTGKQSVFGLSEWLYVFILHRVCGSGINYAVKPSGYHNTILFDLWQSDTIEDMCQQVLDHKASFYTSVGYQYPAFPKPKPNTYKRGGDLFLCEYAPRLARDLASMLESGGKRDFRTIGEWMFKWNAANGLKAYRFQYAAVLADIADWFPEYVNRSSMFYYGTNAVECIGYLANPVGRRGKKSNKFLDAVMARIHADTGSLPYNAEDVACDFIRWIENYVRPGGHYAHVDLDTVFNSSTIKNHPYGRQRAMLDLNIVDTFKDITSHPSDDKVIAAAGLTVQEYQQQVEKVYAP